MAIRDQLDTVRHRDAQAPLDGDVVERGRQPEQARHEAPPVAIQTSRGQPGDQKRDRGSFMHLVPSSVPV